MKELIKKVKEKRELFGIADSLVREVLIKYLRKIHLKKIDSLSEKEKKIIVKEARAELRNYVGRFQSKAGKEKRIAFIKKEDYESLIRTHSSARERKEIYPALIKEIKKLPHNSILDLGCGINPVFIAKELGNLIYFAFDINKNDLEIVNYFFKKEKINGKIFLKDIRKAKFFPETDICLMLKVLDIIEKDNSKAAEKIISKLKCKSIIASFSTKTLSGKLMQHPRRIWFENLLDKRFNYTFEIIRTKNEIFYIVNLQY